MASTVRVFLLSIALCGLSFPADSVSQDLNALRTMTTWNVSKPDDHNIPGTSCGLDLDRYERSRMDHQIGSDVGDERATRQIRLLDRRITSYLNRHHWSAMDVGDDRGEIPNTKRCYLKDETIIQIYQVTSRCTMNTPCSVYDGFAIIVYIPRTKK